MNAGDLGPGLRFVDELLCPGGPGLAEAFRRGAPQPRLRPRLARQDQDHGPGNRRGRRREGANLPAGADRSRRDVETPDPHRVELGSEVVRDDRGSLGEEESVAAGGRSRAPPDERETLPAGSRSERADEEEAKGRTPEELRC